jgi:hypothetical protein
LASLLAVGLALGSFTAQTRAALVRDHAPRATFLSLRRRGAGTGPQPRAVVATYPFAPDRTDRPPRPG